MEFMLICFDGLDTFGKTPGQLANAVKLFLLMLSKYPAVLIRFAFEKWVRTESKMPTPSEIINLIEQDNVRLLDLIDHLRARNGNQITDGATAYLTSKLGKNWRDYV